MTDHPEDLHKAPIVSVLLIGAFMAILNQTLLTTALPHLMRDLNITENSAQWVTTIFMLVNGIMIPITAFLIEKYTTRGLFLTAMLLFAAGTLICALSPSFSTLIMGRIVQASGAGIMMPLMQTSLLLLFPVERRGTAMGMAGLVIAFAPAIGPTLSGWLVEQYHWSILFWVIFPLAVFNIIFASVFLRNISTLRAPSVDILSIVLSTFGFGGLLFGFSSAGDGRWSSMDVWLPIIVGFIALYFFINRQLKLKQPILEFRVFHSRVFALSTVIGVIVFVSMISTATILPIYMQNMNQFTAFEAGLIMLPGAVLMGVMSPIMGRIFDRIGARYLAIPGLTLILITSVLFSFLSSTTSVAYLSIVYALRLMGTAMTMMPVTTAGINSLPRELIPHGTAMNNTMRQVSASIGTALLVTVMTTTALNPKEASVSVDEALVHGVNMSYIAASGLALIGVILALFIRSKPHEEKLTREEENAKSSP
ncbi:EmrB/QacA subfamily drug resistance transporter [Geomicrobium halophilum]|uniref:EmrB/QacA subfamily drug resistance transporter n=1 Tax=Geomicrobium halophilum TaxID=549000 RepID=A0A841PWB1_9BACL|nr:MDR family MFS transporter [Geomicrobium halophilum]MBB6450721.1 EmrB/QacA subfamily drug resistance transporter [Geomicrobium halophilum]